MFIKGTNVEIPDSLIVEGDLDLHGTGITKLPAGLKVVGSIYPNLELIVCAELQLQLIAQNKNHIDILKDPTAAAIRLHNMLWVI